MLLPGMTADASLSPAPVICSEAFSVVDFWESMRISLASTPCIAKEEELTRSDLLLGLGGQILTSVGLSVSHEAVGEMEDRSTDPVSDILNEFECLKVS